MNDLSPNAIELVIRKSMTAYDSAICYSIVLHKNGIFSDSLDLPDDIDSFNIFQSIVDGSIWKPGSTQCIEIKLIEYSDGALLCDIYSDVTWEELHVPPSQQYASDFAAAAQRIMDIGDWNGEYYQLFCP